ncbi:tRNA(Ile)(2)-agmatinylcytidine synthase [Methanospirillum hungatei]|uniref:tRNA(Ile)(2)-agmatinylcytidine synthase n=1 Tax=Methanospirillum hungatei TaxID=2203 RepID=UPI002CA5F4A8|nr:tRNA(Ile)(2)-agmatinylcytidine synthase [Methanospirillum hungatei]HOW04308.1 tRNA(Ile)(2)-agmatinylcytidine synthase [Methanospirillum hungatei]
MDEKLMTNTWFLIGLDDTDAPDGMCTTWLGAVLATLLEKSGMKVFSSRLVRLNPTIPYKTRGNAAISLCVRGDPDYAFSIASDLVEKFAALSCENTHPGIVVSLQKPPADFYWKAVQNHCRIDEARDFLARYAFRFLGYKLGRGLIGATAAVCSEFPDFTWEYLAYRHQSRLKITREVDAESLRLSEDLTRPHTWDTWDPDLKGPVCVPHTPDPVLFGIRGDSPFSVAHAVSVVRSEGVDMARIWKTNQGTDAHLVLYEGSLLTEGISYLIRGRVHETPKTGKGGHVSFPLMASDQKIPCMAFEPTKKFRDFVRSLRPGDEILVAGSYLKNTLNLEKMYIFSVEPYIIARAPICPSCKKRMTSAGSGKGYKCRRCGNRATTPEQIIEKRTISSGWYEVPPGARRHLSRPIARGHVDPDSSSLPSSRKMEH